MDRSTLESDARGGSADERLDVLLFSKSKALTGATRSLVRAFGRQPAVASARRVHHRKLEQLLGARLADRWVRRRLSGGRRRLLVVNHEDARVGWLEQARARGDVIAYVHHAYAAKVSERRMAVARHADFVYVASERQIEEFVAEGVPQVSYLCRGCSTDLHYPASGRIREKWKSDVAFIGRPRAEPTRLRNRLMRAIDERFDLKVYGGDWTTIGLQPVKRTVYPRHYRKICAGARIMIGLSDASEADTFEEMLGWRKYTSNREWLTLGCGGFLLTNYCEGIEEVFRPGVHLDYFRSIDECLDKIGFYLARPELRARIARQGCELVRNHHSFDHFAVRLVEDARKLLEPPIASRASPGGPREVGSPSPGPKGDPRQGA